MSIYRIQLAELSCHGSGNDLWQADTGSELWPESRQALRS